MMIGIEPTPIESIWTKISAQYAWLGKQRRNRRAGQDGILLHGGNIVCLMYEHLAIIKGMASVGSDYQMQELGR
jgi:hypothetical protein